MPARAQPSALTFDPDLPRLQEALDLGAVSALFTERWPGRAPVRSVAVRKALDVKYEPRAWCIAAYDLLAEDEDGGPRPTIGVLEMRPQRVQVRLFDQDPELPWIPETLDAALVARRLASTVPSVARDAVVEAAPVRYKPGGRLVVRYTAFSGAGPQVFFGKTMKADSGRLAADIATLQRAAEGRPGMPRIAGPDAHWPELRMLVQRAVTGREFHEVVFDHDVALESRLRWMTVAGGALAGLHGASDMPAPTQTLAGDIAELDALAAPMAQAAAELAHSFRSVVAALHEARAVDGAASAVDGAASAVDGAAVVSHGAFRTDQFMIEDDGLVMIDLDTLCRARPERDVGNLLAYLRWRALRKPRDAALVAVAPQHFIAGYEESGRRLDEGRTNLFEAASLLKIAGRRFRSLTVREWDLVPELITAARRLLE